MLICRCFFSSAAVKPAAVVVVVDYQEKKLTNKFAFPRVSPVLTFLILVATADLRALLYMRAFSARRWRWMAFCLAKTTTEPRATAADADDDDDGESSTGVPLTDDVDASDGFLRGAGAEADMERPEKALASISFCFLEERRKKRKEKKNEKRN